MNNRLVARYAMRREHRIFRNEAKNSRVFNEMDFNKVHIVTHFVHVLFEEGQILERSRSKR